MARTIDVNVDIEIPDFAKLKELVNPVEPPANRREALERLMELLDDMDAQGGLFTVESVEVRIRLRGGSTWSVELNHKPTG